MTKAATLVEAARAIIRARDFFAEHTAYDPADFHPEADQGFDDWASDILETALAATPGPAPTVAKPAARYFVAIYGDGGLDVQFYTEPLEYGRAVLQAQRDHERGRNDHGEDIDSYINGTVD